MAWPMIGLVAAVAMNETSAPAQVADHLAKRDLTYAALFVACLAVGATIYMGRLLYAAYQQNREDYARAIDAVERLTDAFEKRPCAMAGSGYKVVLEPPGEPPCGEGKACGGDQKQPSSHA